MKTTNLLHILSICSLLIFSARGMDEGNTEDKNPGNGFELIQNSTVRRQKTLSVAYRAWNGLTGKTHTDQVYEYIDLKNQLIDQGYRITLHGKIEKAIAEQYTAISDMNTLFDNTQTPTLQEMIDTKKNKFPHIDMIKELFNIAKINNLQIRDEIKTETTNILEHERSLEKDLIIKASTLSLKKYNGLTQLIQNIKGNKPQIDELSMKQYINLVTNTKPEKDEKGEK